MQITKTKKNQERRFSNKNALKIEDSVNSHIFKEAERFVKYFLCNVASEYRYNNKNVLLLLNTVHTTLMILSRVTRY